jgi:hypothetical protein
MRYPLQLAHGRRVIFPRQGQIIRVEKNRLTCLVSVSIFFIFGKEVKQIICGLKKLQGHRRNGRDPEIRSPGCAGKILPVSAENHSARI